jgi:hypothetical protein
MPCLGFNILKGELYYCLLNGSKPFPNHVDSGVHLFDPNQPKPDLANFFKQTFREIAERSRPTKLAYRLSLDTAKADQFAYLAFPFGILNLLAHEKGLPIAEFTMQAFTKRALGYNGDKFDACEGKISSFPSDAKKGAKVAALAAWMAL